MIAFDETDTCRVTNRGEKDVKIGYNSREYVIKPGQAKGVPVQAALLSFGDPRAVGSIRSWKNPVSNEVGWIPDRASEVRRLRMRYSVQDGPEGGFEGADGKIPLTVPDVSVEYMEEGDWVELATVLDDPTGESASLENNQAIDIQTLQASLEKTQRQLAMLIATQDGEIALGPEEDIPTDSPQVAIAGAKAAAKK
jgi:hypothetical protein